MLTQTQHAVEGNSRIVASALIDRNAVDDVAFAEVFKRPKEMLRGNAEHRGADADAGIERDDIAVPEFLAEAVDEVDFRAHSPLGAGRRGRNGLDDAFGRADFVGGLGDFEAAFGMNDDANAGMFAADALDLAQREALVHRAVAFPEDDTRVADGFRRIAAKFLIRIPNDHPLEWNAHAIAGVAAKMLVGEKEHFFAALEGPLHDGGGVRTGTNRAALLAGEGLDRGGGIHVGDGNDLARIEERRKLVPTGFHLADVGHIGHGTASVEVGQDDHLVRAAENVRAFRHEVHAAEDDVAALGLRRLVRKLEGVAAEIGEFDDFVALIVMAKDDDVIAEAGLCNDVVILGHHYQRDEVVKFADFRGDSLKLSYQAAEAQGRYIVFCG